MPKWNYLVATLILMIEIYLLTREQQAATKNAKTNAYPLDTDTWADNGLMNVIVEMIMVNMAKRLTVVLAVKKQEVDSLVTIGIACIILPLVLHKLFVALCSVLWLL